MLVPPYQAQMSTLFIYLLIAGSAAVSRSEERADAPAPDINDLFPSFNESDQYGDLPAAAYRNISLDIEKLDIHKFKNKMIGEMRPKLLEEDQKRTESGRRFKIMWNLNEGHLNKYYRGYRIMVNQLNCDMTLQLIYMAKSQIAVIENNKLVDKEDTAYRAGFIGHKCKRIFTKMGRILAFMKRWQYAINTSIGHIVLHHRMVRLHIDYLYQYWILINLDSLYRQGFGKKYAPKLPKEDYPTGGVSIENVSPKAKPALTPPPPM